MVLGLSVSSSYQQTLVNIASLSLLLKQLQDIDICVCIGVCPCTEFQAVSPKSL